MAILKLEPYSGISGDMFLGAMAPLADAENLVISLPKALGLENEVSVEFIDVDKNSILCRKAQVKILNPKFTGSPGSRIICEIASSRRSSGELRLRPKPLMGADSGAPEAYFTPMNSAGWPKVVIVLCAPVAGTMVIPSKSPALRTVTVT